MITGRQSVTNIKRINLIQVNQNQYDENSFYNRLEDILDSYFADADDASGASDVVGADHRSDVFLFNAIHLQDISISLRKMWMQYCVKYGIVILVQTAVNILRFSTSGNGTIMSVEDVRQAYGMHFLREDTDLDEKDDNSSDKKDVVTKNEKDMVKIIFLNRPNQICSDEDTPTTFKSWMHEYAAAKSKFISNSTTVCINILGTHDDRVYMGGAMVMNRSDADVILNYWQEGVGTVDLDVMPKNRNKFKTGSKNLNTDLNVKTSDFCWREVYQSLMFGLRQFMRSTGLQSCIIGLSGGIDSTLVTVLAADSLGAQNVHAVFLPSEYTYEIAHSCVNEVLTNVQCRFSILNIDSTVASIHQSLQSLREHDLASRVLENVQSRLRSLLLMAFANQEQSILLANSNKSEILTGYFTLFGDSCGMFAPLRDLYKTDVYSLAKWRNKNVPQDSLNPCNNPIPNSVINRTPTAELRAGQLDSDDLPEYSMLDYFLRRMIDDRDNIKDILGGLEEDFDDIDYHSIRDFIIRNRFKSKFLPSGLRFY